MLTMEKQYQHQLRKKVGSREEEKKEEHQVIKEMRAQISWVRRKRRKWFLKTSEDQYEKI